MDERKLPQLSKLRITKNQLRILLKWALYTIALLATIVLQNVILSRLPVFGAKVNLVPWFVGCVCFFEGADCVFALIASLIWALSGADLGFVAILTLTFGGMAIGLLMQKLLYRQLLTCVGCCLLLSLAHESAIFLLRLFLHTVTLTQYFRILIPSVLLGIPFCPLFFYLSRAIRRVEGGLTWSE